MHMIYVNITVFAAANSHNRIHTHQHTQSVAAFMTAGTAVPKGYWTFRSVINVSFLIDGLYCNYLLKSRNKIIRKGLERRKVLIQ